MFHSTTPVFTFLVIWGMKSSLDVPLWHFWTYNFSDITSLTNKLHLAIALSSWMHWDCNLICNNCCYVINTTWMSFHMIDQLNWSDRDFHNKANLFSWKLESFLWCGYRFSCGCCCWVILCVLKWFYMYVWLSSGSEGLLKLWTIKTNECIKTFDQHLDKVTIVLNIN